MSSSEEEIVIKRQAVKIKPRTIIKSQPRHVELTLNDNTLQTQSQNVDNSDLPDSTSKPKKTKHYDDEDVFFTRSSSFTRNVSLKKTKPVKILKELEENNFDDDDDDLSRHEEDSRRKRPRLKEKTSRLDWTFDDQIDIDSDHTNDLSNFSDETMETNDEKKISDPIDRELSLTPPPELNEYQLRTTVGTLRATLSQYSEGLRSESVDIGSPSISYEPQDDIELDPELLAIQQSIKQPNGKSNRYVDAKVEIMVFPVRHPDIQTMDANRTIQTEFDKPIKFIMKAQDNFERMIKNICEKRNIGKQDIVLTYKKVKVFPRSTPENLGMPGQARMEVFTKDTYNYYKERNDLLKHKMLEEIERESKLFSDNSNESELDNAEKTIQLDNEYLHLKLLSKDETIDKLKIKKTLTVQAVIDHYKKTKNIPDNIQMKLMFEDDALSVTHTLGDTELEDGDMLSVVILNSQ
ncbi:ubiquitin-2 like Rad60 SUMO-like-domain-containing protein [Gigaspora margarita]|uniref:Ubiquitin-2 like Rad60 SUMO-like-domain-containing protein n=1 Tax=Gigaspora margarita TaxID=4874 RepID=A0A8H4EIA7_GIGMA|nr:ubiquitin-2 like Rad60 SUMO-like-domain-containing protein [Gigaspora margarita]